MTGSLLRSMRRECMSCMKGPSYTRQNRPDYSLLINSAIPFRTNAQRSCLQVALWDSELAAMPDGLVGSCVVIEIPCQRPVEIVVPVQVG